MHRHLIRAAQIALGGAVALAMTACGGTDTPEAQPTSPPITGEEGLGNAPRGGEPADSGAPTTDRSSAAGGGQTGGGGQQGGSGRPTAVTPTSRAAGPTIVSFRVAQQPRCPRGTTDGLPVILEWKVTGADQVTISVDGPGVYDTYPTEGSATINFPCGGSPGEQVTHTYQLRTVGGGDVRSRTLTVSATVDGGAQG